MGENFVPGSVIQFGGAPRATNFISETLLTAGVTASEHLEWLILQSHFDATLAKLVAREVQLKDAKASQCLNRSIPQVTRRQL